MSALRLQQRELARLIVDPASDSAAGGLGLSGRLAVYRHAYPERLIGALRDNFGTLAQVMGDEGFRALAQAYVCGHPSRRPSIRWYGQDLPDFMARRPELVAHAAMVDVARLDGAVRCAFDEADARAFEADELRRLDPGEWPALVFAPLPSVCVLDLHWDIEPSWRTLKQAAPGDAAVLSAPAPNPHSVLVWRPQLEVRFRTLTAAAAGLLRAALMGQSFAQVCEHAAAEVGPAHAPSHAAGALREWLADGLFQSWRVVPAAPPQRA